MRQVARLLDRGVELRERLVVESIGLVALALQASELLGASLFVNRHRADGTPGPIISLTIDSRVFCSAGSQVKWQLLGAVGTPRGASRSCPMTR